jgi:hypothetical protein
MKSWKTALVVVLLILSGCTTSPPAQTFTVRAAPQLAAQADLATTAHTVAQQVERDGTRAQSPEATFLADATGIWKTQTGPGQAVPLTTEAVAAEDRKIADAKVKAERDAEAERQAHIAQLDVLKKQLATALNEIKAQSFAAMWTKLLAILLVGGAGIAVCLWFQQVRPFAPFVGIGAAGLAGAVIVRACAGDITIVVILGAVLATLYGLVMWFIEYRKRAVSDRIVDTTTDAIERLPKAVALTVKAAVKDLAGERGVEPQLKERLVGKGYSKAEA